MKSTVVIAQREKPLSPVIKMGIILVLTVLSLTLYLVCLLALPLLGLMFLLAVIALVLMARFGASWIMFPAIRRQWLTARAIFNSLRLEKDERKHLTLTEQDAPHLFATVRECARRVGCLEPTKIVLETGCEAWVALEGLRTGHGKCTLGIGFEFLATLSQEELEAILLHEMAHALKIQRGLRKVTAPGIARWDRLGHIMTALVEEEEERGRQERGGWSTFWIGSLFAWMGRGLTRVGGKLYAAWVRQDEFEADQISAAQCGAEIFGQALLKSALLEINSAQIHWLDRVMQSQREGSYTGWLRAKLIPKDAEEAAKLCQEALEADRRSETNFHPIMADRLAHVGANMPPGERFLSEELHCLSWLADMDGRQSGLP